LFSPGFRNAGQIARAHQPQPEEQPDEQEDLPEPAEVDVLVALVAEPEVHLEAQRCDAVPLPPSSRRR
jgi:hypothetical protein